jgi:hypothetical protein
MACSKKVTLSKFKRKFKIKSLNVAMFAQHSISLALMHYTQHFKAVLQKIKTIVTVSQSKEFQQNNFKQRDKKDNWSIINKDTKG